jgi:hypothetical protein
VFAREFHKGKQMIGPFLCERTEKTKRCISVMRKYFSIYNTVSRRMGRKENRNEWSERDKESTLVILPKIFDPDVSMFCA